MVRVKNRYIVAQLLYNSGSKEKYNELTARDIQTVLREKIIELFGDMGVGEFGNCTLVKFHDSQHSKIFIVRTARESQREVQLTLSCVSKIKDVDISIRSLVIHSCPRTCLEGVRKVLTNYHEGVHPKGVVLNSDALSNTLADLNIVEL